METTLTTAAGTDLDRQLGFVANAVIIDNITNAWATVPATGRQIAPWQHSVVVAIPGTQQAQVRWQTPAGIQATPFDTSQQLIATYTSDQLPSSLGQPVQQQGNAGILLGSFAATEGATTTSQPFAIPQGVDGLFVMVDSAWPGGDDEISVTDPSQTRVYGDFGPILSLPFGTGWLVFPVEPSIDNQVVVIVKLGGTGPTTHTVRVLAITHPAIQLSVVIGNETPLSITGPAGNNASGMPVSTAEIGGNSIQAVSATHANAVVNLGAVAGKSWHVFAITASASAAPTTAQAVSATDGVVTWSTFLPNAARFCQHFDFPDGGMVFGNGNAVAITLTDGGAGIIGAVSVVAALEAF